MELYTGSFNPSDVLGMRNVTQAPSDILGMRNVSQAPSDIESTISSSIQISLAYIIIGVIGMIGNFFVLVVMFSSKNLQSSITNMYIINQSGVDLMVSFLLAITAQIDSNVPYSGLAGHIYCKFWQTKLFLWGFMNSSTYNLLALTFERYLAIVHPIWHKLKFTRTKAKVSIVFLWLCGPLYQSFSMPVTSIVINGQCSLYSQWPSQTAYVIYGLNIVIVQYFVPLIMLTYSYARIALALHRKVQNLQESGSTAPNDKWRRGRRNTIQTLVLVGLSFLACWTVNQIYYFMFCVGLHSPDYSSDFYHGGVITIYLNVCINPFIYSLKYEQFQLAAKRLFSRFLPGNRKIGTLESSAYTNQSSVE